jgi:hypothetical protein
MSRRGRTASGSHRCATSQSSFERFYIMLHCQVGGGGGVGQWVLTIAQARRNRHSQISNFTLPDIHAVVLRVCMCSFCVVVWVCTKHDQICSPNTDPERIAQLPRCCNLLFSISRMRACHICEFEQQCGCHVDVATFERMAWSMHVRWCILIVQPVHPVKSRTLCWSFDAVFCICGEGGVSELSGHPFGHILVCSEPSSGFPDKVCYVLRSKAILNTMQCS